MKRRVLSPQTLLAVLLTTTAPSLAAASPQPTPGVPGEDAALLALRDQLEQAGRDAALADVPRFRPLCDDAGYPLVGNVVRKGATPSYQPSQLCADLEAAKKKS